MCAVHDERECRCWCQAAKYDALCKPALTSIFGVVAYDDVSLRACHVSKCGLGEYFKTRLGASKHVLRANTHRTLSVPSFREMEDVGHGFEGHEGGGGEEGGFF